MATLEGYGTGPHLCRIFADIWEQQEVVTHKNGYHGLKLQVTRGTTQGGLTSSTLFNMVFNNVLHNWLSITVEDKLVAHDRI